MEDKTKLLVVGSVAMDDVETPFGRREVSLGGSAVYFSWASSIFSPVSMVGVVGEDFPTEAIGALKSRGVDTRAIEVVEGGKTFHWKGRYDFDFNVAHTLDTQLNVFAEFEPKLLEDQKEMPYLFLANVDPEIQLKVAKEMKSPAIIATDTMNYWIESKRDKLLEVIAITDFLIVNDAEARQLTGESNLTNACKQILSYGPKVLIVKQGEYGVTMFHSEGEKIDVFSAPSIPLESVLDPTGAGDSFAGAFMGYLAKTGKTDTQNIRKAVAMGCVVASFTVEGFSIDALQKANPEKVIERYNKLRSIAFFEEIAQDELIK